MENVLVKLAGCDKAYSGVTLTADEVRALMRGLGRIETRLHALAIDTFDPEDAQDSDGYDQAAREGIEQALGVVIEEFHRV